jgi:hypothetical protein
MSSGVAVIIVTVVTVVFIYLNVQRRTIHFWKSMNGYMFLLFIRQKHKDAFKMFLKPRSQSHKYGRINDGIIVSMCETEVMMYLVFIWFMPSGKHADEQKCNTLLGMVKTTMYHVIILPTMYHVIILPTMYHVIILTAMYHVICFTNNVPRDYFTNNVPRDYFTNNVPHDYFFNYTITTRIWFIYWNKDSQNKMLWIINMNVKEHNVYVIKMILQSLCFTNNVPHDYFFNYTQNLLHKLVEEYHKLCNIIFMT